MTSYPGYTGRPGHPSAPRAERCLAPSMRQSGRRRSSRTSARQHDTGYGLGRCALKRWVLFVGRAFFRDDGVLIDISESARVFDQVVAEGSDVIADELQDSLAGGGAL